MTARWPGCHTACRMSAPPNLWKQGLCSESTHTETQFSTQNLGRPCLIFTMWLAELRHTSWRKYAEDLLRKQRSSEQRRFNHAAAPSLTLLTFSWLPHSAPRQSSSLPFQHLRSTLTRQRGPQRLDLSSQGKELGPCAGCLLHLHPCGGRDSICTILQSCHIMLLHYNVQPSNSLFNSFLIKFNFIKPK